MADVVKSLWGEEFDIKGEEATKIIEKIKNPKKKKKPVDAEKAVKSKSLSMAERVSIIEAKVKEILGHYESSTKCIRDKEELHRYIDECNENGIIAIDTETNHTTDTLNCIIRGACIYTPTGYNAYIPINHIDPTTEVRLDDQITEKDIKEEFSRLNCKVLMHNSTFDIEVLMTTCDIRVPCWWDTMSAAFVLNENEHKSLKTQYILHIDPEQSKYSIDSLFEKIDCGYFSPELFALYAATDAMMTYKLYEYQKSQFELPNNKEVYELFRTIEMPILDVVVDMETTGVCIDIEYAKRLSAEYHKKSDAIQEKIDEELERLRPTIEKWKLTPEANVHPPAKNKTGIGKSKAEQLSDPIELTSTTQMAILLYDILKVGIVDKDTPRGTGAAILEELAPKVPICQLLLDKRGIDILINTFIDKMPEVVGKDGRVHARFNACGAQTGRFSSSDPNLQNIPSHAKDIRMIFTASPGHSIIGADYSGQEMRVLASLSDDTAMIEAYKNNVDIYATVASLIYKNNVEDNLEFPPSWGGKQNPEGKKRRASAKTVVLGLNYGMSTKSLADRLGEPVDEAQKIVDGYYGGLAGVKAYTDNSQKMLKEKGYVTDAYGRRRHLPDGQLPEYEIKALSAETEFNPLIGAIPHNDVKTENLVKSFKARLSAVTNYRERMVIIDEARRSNLEVKNNGGFIAKAMRQCLNARIQGTSASMTKQAMIMARNDPELQRLGFKLLVTVHDEMYGEAPTENSEQVAKRLSEVMVEAAKTKCDKVPWKCDPYIVGRWYLDEFSAEVLKDYNKMGDIHKVQDKYSYINPDYIEQMCKGEFNVSVYGDI